MDSHHHIFEVFVEVDLDGLLATFGGLVSGRWGWLYVLELVLDCLDCLRVVRLLPLNLTHIGPPNPTADLRRDVFVGFLESYRGSVGELFGVGTLCI